MTSRSKVETRRKILHMRDPLVEAVIARLPLDGHWPRQNRLAWLRMAAMAFDVAYGPQAAIAIGEASEGQQSTSQPASPIVPAPIDPDPAETRFYVGRDGRAVRDPGAKPIMPHDIPPAETLWDERPAGRQDLDAITWADGQQWPAQALPSLNLATP